MESETFVRHKFVPMDGSTCCSGGAGHRPVGGGASGNGDRKFLTVRPLDRR